ncbi:leucine-rich repeat domain-containing protein [Frigoriglobus tundricola]|uniref:Uncharacterized protein n=1 Tax=Frigoriglobus tundricola TaxID=2774151 RepID=A0A6M5Z2F4_9BACT|nr:hypothetical protein [Frigoriglobus tundricola]QJW99362.1 hypothetical protein FTUN_6970 [Frigoriglobus tundricola]
MSWPGLARLESLDVSGCDLRSEGIRALATSTRIENLIRLSVGRNDGGDALSLLLASPRLKCLKELELGGTAFGLHNVISFGEGICAKMLRHLDLDSATFQPEAFVQFTRCPLPALRWLRLNSVELRPLGADRLVRAPFTETLEELYLDNTRLRPEGVEALASGNFPALGTLDLSRNRLDNRGGIALANAVKSFPALTNLRLWDNRLGSNAVVHLAASKLLANLTDLDLSGNKIGVIGAIALAQSKHLKNLASLVVDEKAVTKKGKTALLDRLGESVVSFR